MWGLVVALVVVWVVVKHVLGIATGALHLLPVIAVLLVRVAQNLGPGAGCRGVATQATEGR